MEIKLRKEQMEVLNNLKRFNVLLAHRRLGKTVFAIWLLIIRALECQLNRPQYLYVAPTYSQAKKVAWSYLREFAGKLPNTLFNESELKATLPNGAIIQLGSADNPDALRGIYLDGVVLDEPAQQPTKMWTQVLRPALSDRKGWALMIGTPAGRHGLFYDSYQQASDLPDWYRSSYKASETGIIDEEELQSARRSMSIHEYNQEFECSFDAAIRGAYYSTEMSIAETTGRIGTYLPESNQSVHIALDLGISDATAAWFFQFDGNQITLVDYAEYTNMGLPDIVADWRIRQYTYGKVIVPHDIQVRSLSTGKTRFETLQALGCSLIQAPKTTVEDGIEAVRNTLPRCRFNKIPCNQGVEALRQYRADWQDKAGVLALKPKHDWSSHGADAFRYLAVTPLDTLTNTWSHLDYTTHDRQRTT